ncbi:MULTISPECIES: hypothetical protein [Bacillus cereus group]|nr:MULTISPECIES: hypothetical protein [Bacillus cereus group]KZD72342.1 hypothetical protein B4120_4773 [Bacillus cereus]MCC2351996.1 hypothetical protein [Bacillus pacificus]MCU5247343.1 hypothetical protein [Bacillus pacificus]MCU5467445.1 hypothetical protein [Bacillus pacificus]MDA4083809.1 hypothetical protein [Bacillus cereus]
MKSKLFKVILTIAAVATFTFAPATKQDKVKNVDAPIMYMDPNPGGG